MPGLRCLDLVASISESILTFRDESIRGSIGGRTSGTRRSMDRCWTHLVPKEQDNPVSLPRLSVFLGPFSSFRSPALGAV